MPLLKKNLFYIKCAINAYWFHKMEFLILLCFNSHFSLSLLMTQNLENKFWSVRSKILGAATSSTVWHSWGCFLCLVHVPFFCCQKTAQYMSMWCTRGVEALQREVPAEEFLRSTPGHSNVYPTTIRDYGLSLVFCFLLLKRWEDKVLPKPILLKILLWTISSLSVSVVCDSERSEAFLTRSLTSSSSFTSRAGKPDLDNLTCLLAQCFSNCVRGPEVFSSQCMMDEWFCEMQIKWSTVKSNFKWQFWILTLSFYTYLLYSWITNRSGPTNGP